MPHVASQIRDLPRESPNRQSTSMMMRSTEFQRPAPALPRRRNPMETPEMPSLSLLIASPNSKSSNRGSIQQRRSNISANNTPLSAADSVFELPSAVSYQTPNSSTKSFLAELEDTSPIVFPKFHITELSLDPTELFIDQPRSAGISRSRKSLPPRPRRRPESQLTSGSRASTNMEAITSVEDDNQQLLQRVREVEEKLKMLEQANLTLQHQVDSYADRPKTAPSPSPPSRRTVSESMPMSTFNMVPESPTHNIRRRPPPLELPAKPRDQELPVTSSSMRQRRGQPSNSSVRQAHSHASSISGPIPGSVARNQVTFNGKQIYNPPVARISLADAQRREKPLPYIIPMSPSAVPGFVEMGSRVEVSASEEQERLLRKRKTFGDLFRWGKRQGVRV